MIKQFVLNSALFIFVLTGFSQSMNDIEYSSPIMGDFKFEITDSGINSKQHEYGSGFFKERYIVVSAKKIGVIGGDKDPISGEPHTQLFCATVAENGDLSKLVLYSRIINTNKNEGSITFTPDEKTIYFTRSERKNTRNYQLFKAYDLDGYGQWVNEEKINFSSPDYSIENVFISNDGKKLYFSSNMPGGEGGYDLYSVTLDDDGTLGTPVNLGNKINTTKDEITPFIDSENKYLYFSSNGYNSLGGQDIFKIRITKNGFSRVINLGPNINSTENDYAFNLSDQKNGYITSAKPGGIGGTDIYKISSSEPEKYKINGYIKDAITQEILPNSTIEVLDVDGELVDKQKANEDGSYSFDLAPYETYTIRSNKEGYEENLISKETNSTAKTIFNLDINLNKKIPDPIVLEDDTKTMTKIKSIYFPFNDKNLTQYSVNILNELIKNIETPFKKIKLVGHTDSFGLDDYNYKLGMNRAKSVKELFDDNNIGNISIEVISEGEKNPIIKCNNCSSKKLLLNRRVDIYILN